MAVNKAEHFFPFFNYSKNSETQRLALRCKCRHHLARSKPPAISASWNKVTAQSQAAAADRQDAALPAGCWEQWVHLAVPGPADQGRQPRGAGLFPPALLIHRAAWQWGFLGLTLARKPQLRLFMELAPDFPQQ